MKFVVGMWREAELVVLGRRVRRVVNEPNRAVRLGERRGEIIGRQVERQMLYWSTLSASLSLFGTREELLGDGEGVVDQVLRHAVIGDDEKPGSSCLAGEIRGDIEHRNAALGGGLGLCRRG
jgi:hypothetical protein